LIEPWLSKTLAAADQFLTSLGWLEKPTGAFPDSDKEPMPVGKRILVPSDTVLIPN
jgi:hypothetical protein